MIEKLPITLPLTHISDELNDVLALLLSKNPANRPSVNELYDKFEFVRE